MHSHGQLVSTINFNFLLVPNGTIITPWFMRGTRRAGKYLQKKKFNPGWSINWDSEFGIFLRTFTTWWIILYQMHYSSHDQRCYPGCTTWKQFGHITRPLNPAKSIRSAFFCVIGCVLNLFVFIYLYYYFSHWHYYVQRSWSSWHHGRCQSLGSIVNYYNQGVCLFVCRSVLRVPPLQSQRGPAHATPCPLPWICLSRV